MANYAIGQKLYDPEKDYLTDNKVEEAVKCVNRADVYKIFKDYFIFSDEALSNKVNYFLKFQIKNESKEAQSFKVKILNSIVNKDGSEPIVEVNPDLPHIRTIKNISVNNTNTSFEIIFNPIEDGDYNTILIELERNQSDLGAKERTYEVTEVSLQEINNLFENNEVVTEIGLQGTIGQLFTIDGEELRIGKSGIYEMHYDNITMTNIGIVTDKNGDAFILDYKYKVKEANN